MFILMQFNVHCTNASNCFGVICICSVRTLVTKSKLDYRLHKLYCIGISDNMMVILKFLPSRTHSGVELYNGFFVCLCEVKYDRFHIEMTTSIVH